MPRRRSPLPGQWARSFRKAGRTGATGFKKITDESRARTRASVKRYSTRSAARARPGGSRPATTATSSGST